MNLHMQEDKWNKKYLVLKEKQPFGAAFRFPKPTNEGGERHGQSAGQENRAGKRNVPARAEIG